MAEAQYFFATLAQATASIVGFIIAVGVGLHTIERQRVERRTNEYRKELGKLKEKYEDPLDSIFWMLKGVQNERIEEGYEKTSTLDNFICHLDAIQLQLGAIKPDNDYILSDSQLLSLETDTARLERRLRTSGGKGDALMQEVDGKELSREDDVMLRPYFAEQSAPVDYRAGELRRWIQIHNNPGSYDPERPYSESIDIEDTYPMTGYNLLTIRNIISQFRQDIQEVRKESSGSVIHYTPGIQTIIRIAVCLLFTGVLVPIASLLTVPSLIPINWISAFQVILLISTTSLLVPLVEILLKSSNTTNELSDEDSLSYFSLIIISIIGSDV